MTKFILISPNVVLKNRINLLCQDEQKFCFLNHFFDEKSAMVFICQTPVDFVFLDLFLFDADSLSFAEKIKRDFPKIRLVLITDFLSNELNSCAKQIGIENIISTNISFDVLSCVLLKTSENGNVTKLENTNLKNNIDKNKLIDEKISNICLNVGLSPRNLGYQYFKEAIKIATANPNVMGKITKQLYPEIATKFNTTASRVERALRHALLLAFDTENFKNLNQILGFTVAKENRRITSTEFIALVSDKIALDIS